MIEPVGENSDHHLAKFPYGGRCLGCEMASLELEKFLIRGTGRTVMGDWTDGWLRAILQEPTKYRDTANAKPQKQGRATPKAKA
jgi:hypothetical protein